MSTVPLTTPEQLDLRVSPNLLYREMVCPCCGLAIYTLPLLLAFEKLREGLGGHPLFIVEGGGYRCPKYAALLPPSSYRTHETGNALDVRSRDIDLHSPEAFRTMIAAGFKGIGRGTHKSGALITHLDVGRRVHAFWKYVRGERVVDDAAYELYQEMVNSDAPSD
jgi:hypothetical protein